MQYGDPVASKQIRGIFLNYEGSKAIIATMTGTVAVERESVKKVVHLVMLDLELGTPVEFRDGTAYLLGVSGDKFIIIYEQQAIEIDPLRVKWPVTTQLCAGIRGYLVSASVGFVKFISTKGEVFYAPAHYIKDDIRSFTLGDLISVDMGSYRTTGLFLECKGTAAKVTVLNHDNEWYVLTTHLDKVVKV